MEHLVACSDPYQLDAVTGQPVCPGTVLLLTRSELQSFPDLSLAEGAEIAAAALILWSLAHAIREVMWVLRGK